MADLIGRGPTLGAISLGALLAGSLLTRSPDLRFSRLREQDTWGAFQGWIDELREDEDVANALLKKYRYADMEEVNPVPRMLQTHDSVVGVIRAGMDDYQGIVTSLQIKSPEHYDTYDRICAEAELRYSLVIPLYVFAAYAAYSISPWYLFAALLPMAVNRQGDRLSRDAVEFIMQIMVNGVAESPYTAALRRFKASLAGSGQQESSSDPVSSDSTATATATATATGRAVDASDASDDDEDEDEDDWDDESWDEEGWDWEQEPKWWWRSGRWVAKVVWPGGAFSWQPTPWDQETRARRLRGFVGRPIWFVKEWRERRVSAGDAG